ncbi:MAG: extracellular solute-binding protein, family 5 [Geminicoccaceae bacterium]|nr:extracellular solute-binding protein, family 5 [Geminicoccaceae bacterium]
MTDHSATNWTHADDAMVEGAIRRGASRRELLRMLMAGGVSLAVGGSILGRASAAIAATPVMGGHLKAAGFTASTADTLDPAKGSNATDYTRACAYYNRLTFLNENSEVQMELAESVETTDAKVWTVKLKSGVEFHDGKTKATGPLTVEITLVGPNADLPTILALHHFMIVQDGTTDFSKGIGTGAFRSEVFEPGVKSIGVRNENYFKAQKASAPCSRATCRSPRRSSRSRYASSRACPASSSSGIPSATTPTSTCASTWRRATRPGSSRASSSS